MEDYDKFIQYQLSQLKKRRGSNENQLTESSVFTRHSSSAIRFHGLPILPPLLRLAPTVEEFFQGEPGLMLAKNANFHAGTGRHGQASLNDVATASLTESVSPLNRTLMHEGKSGALVPGPCLTSTTCSASATNHLAAFDNGTAVTDALPDSLPCDPLTRSHARETTRGSEQTETPMWENLAANRDGGISPGCVLAEDLRSGTNVDLLADISHRSESSGYVTYENAEAAGAWSRPEAWGSLTSGPGGSPICTGTFFLHSTLDPNATKACAIISHPPVDAEDLDEGSPACDVAVELVWSAAEAGSARTLCSGNLASPAHSQAGVESSPAHGDSVTPRPMGDLAGSQPGKEEQRSSWLPPCLPEPGTLASPQAEASAPDLLEPGQNPLSNPLLDAELVRPNGPYRLSLQTLLKKSHVALNLPKPVRSQPEPKPAPNSRTGGVDPDLETGAPDRPYRLSLQTLLKKSQEHRRRQRQLKNQARSGSTGPVRIGETVTRPQIAEEEEEHGFSDKENEEFSRSGSVVAAEGVKTVDRDQGKDPPEIAVLSTGPQPPEKFPMDAWVQPEDGKDQAGMEGVARSQEKQSSEGILTEWESGNGPGLLEDRQIQSHPGPGLDVELHLAPDVSAALPNLPHPIPAAASPAQESFYLVREKSHVPGPPRPSSLRAGKFQTVPSPQFCMSPVRRKGGVARGGGGGGAAKRQLQVNAPLNIDSKVRSGTGMREGLRGGRGDSDRAPLAAGGGMTRTASLGRSSLGQADEMAQLELNLSSLKTLISDLESKLIETPGNQRTSNSHATDDVEPSSKHTDCQTPDRQADNFGDLNADLPGNFRDYQTAPCHRTERNLAETSDAVATLAGGVARNVPGCGRPGSRQQPTAARPVTSLAQKMRVADVFRKVPPNVVQVPASRQTPVSILSDASNVRRQPAGDRSGREEPAPSLSVNESYDVETPSGLWLRGGSGSEGSSEGHRPGGKQLTPENAGGGLGGASRAKRRLVMQKTEGSEGGAGEELGVRPQSSTPKAVGRSRGQENQRLQLKEAHVAQVRALKEAQRRQQQQLLQTLSMRYQQLQSLSFPVSSRATFSLCPGEEKTSLHCSSFPPSSPPMGPCSFLELDSPSQPVSGLSVRYCPLVAAAVKGFLTRRLLRTERVGQLLRTIKDSQQFLQAFQTPGREFTSRQDQVLHERVQLQSLSAIVPGLFQLRSARYEVQDIFFSLPPGERMKIISRDRRRIRERDMRHKAGQPGLTKSSLSAATLKALERKTATMTQRKAAEKRRGTGVVAGPVTGQRGPPTGADRSVVRTTRGSFRPNPQRVPKNIPARRSR
ncbi:uncharacterized protein si:ch73-100l22.3 isoform X3 [Esox lucius]|uniref:uncharacterized protein si:ch73-100l22.3 isoform X3 n=1 Tax=Esox lucius TaxID=8010 RepID=UPI001476AFCF|nr:uncharacterized protein si:ch73-100l22.3 isoform X3 [Esox lucius]